MTLGLIGLMVCLFSHFVQFWVLWVCVLTFGVRFYSFREYFWFGSGFQVRLESNIVGKTDFELKYNFSLIAI